ncbi:DUF4307 domain-containing protein [Aeromicrobium sp. UC242_57]|uniref:DUF4307 domain-containing protein n=1 Tax=Aeromicrobium sp. UC242_57 TaxID=3374624 RepID=UPI003791B757
MTDLNARYGSRQRPRWVWPVVAVAGVALGIAFAAWVGFQKDPVSAKLWAYDVIDDKQVEIKLDVTRPDPLAVRCTIYAQAADHVIVGEKTIDIPAASKETVRVSATIETERRAVNGVLRTCVAAD